MIRRCIALATMTLLLGTLSARPDVPAFSTLMGTLPSGSSYELLMPAQWNGKLLLYSHGYAPRSATFNDRFLSAPGWAPWMAEHGYAVAGASYTQQGWAVQEALRDQMALLDVVPLRAGRVPSRTIAVGQSMGGLITAALVQLHPERFTGAVALCGVVSGTTPMFNQDRNALFALHTLLGLPLPAPGNPKFADIDRATTAQLATIASTAAGRARLALVAALLQIPGWDPNGATAPDPTNATQILDNQLAEISVVSYVTLITDEADFRAGGAMSSTKGVDFKHILASWPLRAVVESAYRTAGLSLNADLARLNAAAPLLASPQGAAYAAHYFDLSGAITVPVLAMHTLGDDLVPVSVENTYSAHVAANGDAAMLQQTYVGRYGHCNFSAAEVIVAIQALEARIAGGSWGDTSAEHLNAAALALGPTVNELRNLAAVQPAFTAFTPSPMFP